MNKREQILAVLLVMCTTGWALEYHHSQTSSELAALRQTVVEASLAGQSLNTPLTAAAFGTLTQPIDTTDKDPKP